MTDSLKDQLLKLGFKTAPREERRPPPKPAHGAAPARHEGRRHEPRKDVRGGQPGQAPARDTRPPAVRRDGRKQGDIDLAKAYAIRSQREKDERIAAEKLKQEQAARRREGKVKLAELLNTASLNDAGADIARHFEYGGKIRRIYVTAEQLRRLNLGEFAVVQQGGRYHLVSPQDAEAAEALLPGALALLVDPNVPVVEGDYADPQYRVPDDLVW
jgi:uncharacterized protein YaiL (DUF2058 family)